jgi:hypothetical protein
MNLGSFAASKAPMIPESPESKAKQDVFINRILTVMGKTLTAQLVSFSGWMIAGFGAVLGLLLSNLDKVSPLLPVTSIGFAVKLFVVAVALNLLQRYLAAIVGSAVAAAEEVEKIKTPDDLDHHYLLSQIESSMYWPSILLTRKINKKILAGDYSIGGRMVAKMAQIQAWFVVSQFGAVLVAAWNIANTLHA